MGTGTSSSGDYTRSNPEIAVKSCKFCVGSCIITRPTCTRVHCDWDLADKQPLSRPEPHDAGPSPIGGYATTVPAGAPRSQPEPNSQWPLVQVGLMITQDPTQKLHENRAIYMLDPVLSPDPPALVSIVTSRPFLENELASRLAHFQEGAWGGKGGSRWVGG